MQGLPRSTSTSASATAASAAAYVLQYVGMVNGGTRPLAVAPNTVKLTTIPTVLYFLPFVKTTR